MLERYLRNKMILSVAGIVIGLILMIWRGLFIEQMIRVTGYVLLAAAAAYLVVYFRHHRQDETLLGCSVFAAGSGLLLILLSRMLLNAFPVIAGVIMMMSGAGSLMETFGDRNTPVYVKLLSVLVIGLGILIVIQPGRIADMIVFCVGAGLVVNGISGLIMTRRI